MAVIRYAASGVLRNRRRTFSSIIGVLLAITFIAGSFIAIDSSTRSALDAALSGVPGDLSFTALGQAGDNGSALLDAARAVSGVTDAAVYRSTSVLYFDAPANASQSGFPRQTSGTVDGIRPDHLPAAYRDLSLVGTLALPSGSIAITDLVASQLELSLGDKVNVSTMYYSGIEPQYHNLTLNISGIFTILSTPYGGVGPGIIVGPGPYNPVGGVVNLGFYDGFIGALAIPESPPYIHGEIWIDRGRFVNAYDADATAATMIRLQRQLTTVLYQAGGSAVQMTDNISGRLALFSLQMAFQRILYLLLSTPVIFLGLYLGAVGVDLGHAERRRELGVLKTRGASRGQIAALLILESVLGGLLAAAFGLVAGVVLSRFLLSYVNPFGSTFVPGFGDLFLSWETVVTVSVLSILFMGLVSFQSARRTAGLPVVEALRYYAPGETRLRYSPLGDILMVSYAVAAYVISGLLRGTPGNLFTFLFLIIFTLSLPVAPILIIVGATHLATRATGRVYGWAARLSRPFAKNLEYMISHNLTRNPRRASNVAIIIALGLGFGLFVVSALSSQQVFQARMIRAQVGADMSVTPPYPRTFSSTGQPLFDAGFATNLSHVPGVAAITHVNQVPSAEPSVIAGPYSSVSVYALDPATYFSATHPESFFFEPSSEADVVDALSTTNTIVVTAGYADAAALRVGDLVPITAQFYVNQTPTTVTVTTTVGAVVRFLPGISYPSGTPMIVYGSFATFAKFYQAGQASGYIVFGTERHLVALSSGADWRTVKAAIEGIGAAYVSVYQEQLDAALNNPYTGSILGFMEMEIAFIVVILTVGLALIIYAASLERDVEFAGIIARGASGWQTAGLLVGEAFSIMLIGVVVGAAVGLVTSYFLVQSIFFIGSTANESAVPYLFSFPLEGLLLLTLAPAAMLLGALLVSWRTARMNVARVLKMRGG